MALREHMGVIFASLIALLLQIIVSPSISLLYATPNFLMIFCFMLALVRHSTTALVVAFVLGMFYNLIGTAPLGSMAVVLLIVSGILVMVFSVIEGAHPAVAIPTLALSCIVGEILYAFVLIVLGQEMSLFDACIYEALPCALYDSLLCLLFYPLCLRLLSSRSVGIKPTHETVRLR